MICGLNQPSDELVILLTNLTKGRFFLDVEI